MNVKNFLTTLLLIGGLAGLAYLCRKLAPPWNYVFFGIIGVAAFYVLYVYIQNL